MKTHTVFFPASFTARAKANADKYAWAAAMQKQITDGAAPWMALSDEQLWALMFGHRITRSWMVWSDGHCPACKNAVPMYTWEMNALERPWKVRCPHCGELFPKNDFAAFYRSGLDEHGVFDAERADRTLLFNLEHPDPADPLHTFGVDDGEGFVEGDKRWRFIGAYLIYGQWKQAVLGGIRRLADAYSVTGEPAYAHKAGVLLDRVADLYPTFDFAKEGLVYEEQGAAGYVSTWHDACEETRELALAYDQVFDAIQQDQALAAFLAEKARQYKLGNLKPTFADIQANIENGILRDAVRNEQKIRSNYPRTDVALVTIKTILDWPTNRDEVHGLLGGIIDRLTAVDGVTGEKGLANYSAYAVQAGAALLARYAALEPGFLSDVLQRHPQLHQTFRFHIDTWCLGKYYPLSGDSGQFAEPIAHYRGVSFSRNPGADPSMYTFLWRLYELTGDEAFVQVLCRANGDSTDGLPYDLAAADPDAFQKGVAEVIARAGPVPALGSVNKQQWHLAILRSGEGADARAAWLDYDAGGGHGHADGMNLGLFAKGLDLMPDLGYPPVNYGGWDSPRSRWYSMTASHNTVVVDGRKQSAFDGATTLWADGERFRAIRASAPEAVGERFERTIAMVDISPEDSYLLDVFRVVGGTDHAKFMHSHFARIATDGLSLRPADDYGYATQMRGFRTDPAPRPGWSVDWAIEDRYGLLPAEAHVHLRYTDLTAGAQASTAEGWVALGGYNRSETAWIPRIMVRRQAAEPPLASTFVGVIEPYEGQPKIAEIRRLPLATAQGAPCAESDVAVEIRLADGCRDLLVAADVERPLDGAPAADTFPVMVQQDWGLRIEGEMALVRRGADGAVARIALCRGRSLSAGGVALALKATTDFVEICFEKGVPRVVAGSPGQIEDICIDGRSVWGR